MSSTCGTGNVVCSPCWPAARSYRLADIDTVEQEQILGSTDRINEGPPGLVELHRPFERGSPRPRIGAGEAIGM